MRRRDFIVGFAGAAVARPAAARAEQPAKVPRIAFLLMNNPFDSPELEAFRQGLRAHGYVEGQSLAIEYRTAEGRMERLRELAADLLRLKVDLIVASSLTAVRALHAATTSIPIVGLSMATLLAMVSLPASLAPVATSRGSPLPARSWCRSVCRCSKKPSLKRHVSRPFGNRVP